PAIYSPTSAGRARLPRRSVATCVKPRGGPAPALASFGFGICRASNPQRTRWLHRQCAAFHHQRARHTQCFSSLAIWLGPHNSSVPLCLLRYAILLLVAGASRLVLGPDE